MANKSAICRAKSVYRNWLCYCMMSCRPFPVLRHRLNYCNCFRCGHPNCCPHCRYSVQNIRVFRSIFCPTSTLPLWWRTERILRFLSRTIRRWEMWALVQLKFFPSILLHTTNSFIFFSNSHHFFPSLCRCYL